MSTSWTGLPISALRTAPPTTRASSPPPVENIDQARESVAAVRSVRTAHLRRGRRSSASSHWNLPRHDLAVLDMGGHERARVPAGKEALVGEARENEREPCEKEPEGAPRPGLRRNHVASGEDEEDREQREGREEKDPPPRRWPGSCAVQPLVHVAQDAGRHAPDVPLAEGDRVVAAGAGPAIRANAARGSSCPSGSRAAPRRRLRPRAG